MIIFKDRVTGKKHTVLSVYSVYKLTSADPLFLYNFQHNHLGSVRSVWLIFIFSQDLSYFDFVSLGDELFSDAYRPKLSEDGTMWVFEAKVRYV
jgi:hypothetical protein